MNVIDCGIVKYETQHASDLLRIARAMHAESAFAPIPIAEDKLREQFAMSLVNPNIYLRLWMNDAEIVGGLWGFLASPYWTRESFAYDRAWFILPGRRGGVAAVRLFQDFERWAKEMGAILIMPGQTTCVKVEETKELFQHLGCRVVGVNAMKAI